MDLKVHLPVVTIPLGNGYSYNYFCSQFLPMFYRIPKEILEVKGKELLDIPRTPFLAFNDEETILRINSDIFMNGVINSVAYMVWPYLKVSPKMEVYSNHDPAWIIAYTLPIWVKGFMDYAGMWDAKELKVQTDSFPQFKYDFIPMERMQQDLAVVVPQVMKQYNLDKVIEVIKEYRCFEDFDESWESNQKIDFLRKWYHRRTKHPMTSLDAHIEDYAKNNNGMQWDAVDDSFDLEESVISEVDVAAFMNTLSEKDKQILELRTKGLTHKEIAKEVGYKNHSGVIKRITKIGEAYQKFANVDFGFGEEN